LHCQLLASANSNSLFLSVIFITILFKINYFLFALNLAETAYHDASQIAN